MALLSGFPTIDATSNTFSDWLNRTNEMSNLFRGDTAEGGVVTANSTGANTDGNARINGELGGNTVFVTTALRGGDLSVGSGTGSANLSITSNAIFTSTANLVTIEKYLQVDTDSLFVGNVEAQSTIEFTGNDSTLEFEGANQNFIWLNSNTYATIRTDSDGSLELIADINGDSGNISSIDLKVDSVNVASFIEGGDVSFYSANGSEQRLYWDAANLVLGVNTASPQTDVALDVVGNTHTLDLNVANQTTSGNVVVDNELRGANTTGYSGNTLFVTTNAEFTNAQVLIRNDLFVEGDAQVTSNLTVNTDSTFVGDIDVQTDSLLRGAVEAQSTIQFTGNDSTLEFVGANQTFIWDSTESTIRTNADGSLIIDADKTASGVSTTQLDLRVDNKNSVRIEDDHVAFYNQAGDTKGLYWNATELVLGVNTDTPDTSVELDVDGTTQTTDLVVDNTVLANVITVEHSLKGSANLEISSNVTFQANALAEGDLVVDGTLTPTTLSYVIDSTNYNDLIPTANGDSLGNTTNRWEAHLTDLDVSANVEVGGNLTVIDTITTDTLIVSNTAALPSEISFLGVTDFEDITVSGTANIQSLEVQTLTTNSAALVGVDDATVTTSANVTIDQFDSSTTGGFKYIVHGTNDVNGVYMVEINCAHDGSDIYFTRFGEVSNSFDAELTPVVNGSNIELIANCVSASGSNAHSFNIVRIETR